MINEISDKTKFKITSSYFENKVWAFQQLTITLKHKCDLSVKLLVNTTLVTHIFTNKLYSNEYPLIWKLCDG